LVRGGATCESGNVYTYDEIRHVHLEPTTSCNAGCPMCARNACGSPAPNLPRAELSGADVRAILPVDLLSHVDAIDMCGAYGDPALTAELVQIVDYLRSARPDCAITLYTNGGMRSPGWWRDLAQTLGDPARVIFAIDGLADTNGIYRRGVDFQRVIRNAKAFINAGGEARWEFLAFRHNEHQIASARSLSLELGFSEFSVKRTQRFLEAAYDYVPEYRDSRPNLDRFPIWSAAGEVIGQLEPPRDPALVNSTAQQFPDLLARYGSLDELFSATPIHCPVLDTSSVFVSAQAYAFPCCWTYVQATRPGLNAFPKGADRQMYDLVAEYGGFDAVDARRIGLRAVVEGALFGAIERSWSCGSVGEGKLRVCARACGTAFPAYFDQFVDAELRPRSLQLPVAEATKP
jgi:hypothetical protein